MVIYVAPDKAQSEGTYYTPAWLDTHGASAGALALFERHGVTFSGRHVNAFRIKSAAFPTMFIARIVTPPAHLRWARTGANSRRHLFMFVNQGSVEVSDSAQRMVTDGDGLCVLLAGPGIAEFSMLTTSEVLLFAFDAHEVAPIDLNAANVRDISSRSVIFRSAYAFLLALLDSPDEGQQLLSEPLRQLTRDVARALVSDTGGQLSGDSEFVRAQKLLMAYAPSPTFTPEDLAQRLQISRRTLSRIYQAQGLTVAQELRRLRLMLAREYLSSGAPSSMAQIAEASGFGSEDALTRSFRKQYGESPALFRARAASMRTAAE